MILRDIFLLFTHCARRSEISGVSTLCSDVFLSLLSAQLDTLVHTIVVFFFPVKYCTIDHGRVLDRYSLKL